MTQIGPEEQKLREHLKDAMHFNVWWGPEAHKLTVEQRAKTLNDAFDQIARGDCELIDDIDGFDCPPEIKYAGVAKQANASGLNPDDFGLAGSYPAARTISAG